MTYFEHTRREIASLLPTRLGRVLEVGCGTGATLRWLKAEHPEIETTGVEYEPAAGAVLKTNVDHALVGSITDLLPTLGTYDTILCLDVLEHLTDGDAILRGLVEHLAPGGAVLVSLPNVAHLSVAVPLLLRRRFPYADAGILDRTHVRFFVEDSVVRLMNDAGLHIEAGWLSGMQGPRAKLLDRLTFGLLRHHLTKQYVFRARRSQSESQPPVAWAPL